MNKWLKRKVRRWLGLDESIILSDLGIYDHSVIVVATKAGGGRVKIIRAKFEDVRHWDTAIHWMKKAYGIPQESQIMDVPPSVRQERRM